MRAIVLQLRSAPFDLEEQEASFFSELMTSSEDRWVRIAETGQHYHDHAQSERKVLEA